MIELFVTFSQQGLDQATYKIIRPDYSYVLKDAGNIAFALALSQTDLDGIPIFPDEFAPKRNDYLLKASPDQGATFLELQGGRVTDVGLESDTGVIQVAGRDWLDYWDQPFPLSYSGSYADYADTIDGAFRGYVTAAGVDTFNIKYNSTQQSILEDFIATMNTKSDLVFTASFAGGGWSNVLKYLINYLDPTTMLAHMQAIGALNDPFGFDFYCDWDKRIYFYSPRLVVDTSTVVPLRSLSYGDECLIKVDWHNFGPKATRTVAHSDTGLFKESVFGGSITEFRDFLEILELGEAFTYGTTAAELQNLVDVATGAIGALDRNPQKDLKLTVDPLLLFAPDEITGFATMVGQAIHYDSLDQFGPYHRIDADYWIISQSYRTDDDSGNYVLDLGLQQIYPVL